MKTQRQHFFLLLITVLLLGACDTLKPYGKSSSSSSKGKTQPSITDRYKTSDKSDKATTGSRTPSKTKPATKTKTDPYADIDRNSWDDDTDIYGDATERVKTSGKKQQSRVDDATEDVSSRASSIKKKKESQFDELVENASSDTKKRKATDFDFSDPDEDNGDVDNIEYDKDVFNSLNTKVRDAEDDPYADEEDAAESLPLIFFEKFSAKLDRTALNSLSVVYDYMKENPSVSLSVLGEASEYAKNESNSQLAFQRANAVVETLHEWGIASNRLFVPENYSTMQRETKTVEEHYFAMFVDGEVDDYDWNNDLARKRRSQITTNTDDEPEEDEEVKPVSRVEEDDNDTDTDGTRHKVVKGDTLHNLAVRYQTTVARIKKRNGLQSDTIKIGQVLVID